MNTKAVQMIVIPAHEQLDHTVQIGNRQAISQPDPAPNRRVNIPKQHLQPQQQRRVLRAHSPTIAQHFRLCPRNGMGSSGSKMTNTPWCRMGGVTAPQRRSFAMTSSATPATDRWAASPSV
jgi:hypothetical protein